MSTGQKVAIGGATVGLALAAAMLIRKGKVKPAAQALSNAVTEAKPQPVAETATEIIKKAKKASPRINN